MSENELRTLHRAIEWAYLKDLVWLDWIMGDDRWGQSRIDIHGRMAEFTERLAYERYLKEDEI